MSENTFTEHGYQLVRNAIDKETLKFLQINMDVHENMYKVLVPPSPGKPFPFGDPQSPMSFSWYGSIHSESLLIYMKKIISEITQLELNESYSYSRTYFFGSPLLEHVDRPSCEISSTVCVQKGDTQWPIFFKLSSGKTVEIELENGDMIVYRGNILPHWREPYRGSAHRQVFLHYVNANGEYSEQYKYDGRPALALSGEFRNTVIHKS